MKRSLAADRADVIRSPSGQASDKLEKAARWLVGDYVDAQVIERLIAGIDKRLCGRKHVRKGVGFPLQADAHIRKQRLDAGNPKRLGKNAQAIIQRFGKAARRMALPSCAAAC